MPVESTGTELVRREARALGSPLRLTVAGGAREDHLDAAWAAIQAEFDAVDRALSRYREDSELTRLNRSGTLEQPSRRLVAALVAARRAGRLTHGRFDATVLANLERLGSVGVPQRGAWWDDMPDPREVPEPRRRSSAATLLRVGSRDGSISLSAPVDLGGIGKGLALRWAAKRARAVLDGTSATGAGFLLEAGGDIVSRGLFGHARWSIGIEDPAGAARSDPGPVAVCVLERDQAIATSSIRIAQWVDPEGRPAHHLIDPRTGESGGAGLAAVTVAAPDPAWAEVWSKALFLEGAAGIATVARARGLAAWWVDADGALSMTPAARQQTSWVRAEAA